MGAAGKVPSTTQKKDTVLKHQSNVASPEKRSCCLRDLSRYEKEKVARLIRKVVEQAEEIQQISNKHQQAVKLMQQLKVKNQDIVRDNASLRAKLTHSFALLRTYQHKVAMMGTQSALPSGPATPLTQATGAQPLQPFDPATTGQPGSSEASNNPLQHGSQHFPAACPCVLPDQTCHHPQTQQPLHAGTSFSGPLGLALQPLTGHPAQANASLQPILPAAMIAPGHSASGVRPCPMQPPFAQPSLPQPTHPALQPQTWLTQQTPAVLRFQSAPAPPETSQNHPARSMFNQPSEDQRPFAGFSSHKTPALQPFVTADGVPSSSSRSMQPCTRSVDVGRVHAGHLSSGQSQHASSLSDAQPPATDVQSAATLHAPPAYRMMPAAAPSLLDASEQRHVLHDSGEGRQHEVPNPTPDPPANACMPSHPGLNQEGGQSLAQSAVIPHPAATAAQPPCATQQDAPAGESGPRDRQSTCWTDGVAPSPPVAHPSNRSLQTPALGPSSSSQQGSDWAPPVMQPIHAAQGWIEHLPSTAPCPRQDGSDLEAHTLSAATPGPHAPGQERSDEPGWIDQMVHPALDQPGEASSGSETSNDVLMMKGQVIRFDPTIGPHGAFCYEEHHSPVKVAPLQACESDTRSDASSETSSRARAPLTHQPAEQTAIQSGAMQRPHHSAGNGAHDEATAAKAICKQSQISGEACRGAASHDQNSLLQPAVGNASRPRSADDVVMRASDEEPNPNQEGAPIPTSETDQRQHCGFQSGRNPDQGYDDQRQDSLRDSDGQSYMEKVQQRKQSERPTHQAESRYPPASCASSIQQFDPGLTDLIKEVDSLVSTPARRPTHSDWNWLDQQLASRRGARGHGGTAAADVLSEASWSQWDSLCEENDVISLISEQDDI